MTPLRGWIDEVSDFAEANAEETSPLAAMISAVADGKPLTNLDAARLRVLMADQAIERGLTWAQIARVYGYPSGKQAKKMIHGLRDRVKRAERLGSAP